MNEQAAVLALVEAVDQVKGISRHGLAAMLDLVVPSTIIEGTLTGLEDLDPEDLEKLRAAVPPGAVDRWTAQLDELLARPGLSLSTVVDESYPLNLRMIYDRPPFLFCSGELRPSDDRAVAVVGTRRPSPAGLAQAAKLAAGLARAGVTVVSGLAEGIDTAAHRAAIGAGGRTLAVLGHGILRPIFPKSNTDLAGQIASGYGALVSQFWPTAPPTQHSFPIRNVTTSGLSVGTVVIEAGETSGARQQARKCLEHAKQLFLLRDLATHQKWAREYAQRPGVVVIEDVDEVLSRLDLLVPELKPVQLTLA